MNSALAIASVVLAIVNVCAAVASVTFAIQSSVAARRLERRRRDLWRR